MQAVDVSIDDVVVGKRHRKDLGDLGRLASSIETEGLLQPIGITGDRELVFGQRRIKAVQILGWDRIAAVVVDVSSIASGEFDENVIRKDFTTMERVAIGKTLEDQLGDRHGERTDLVEPTEEDSELSDSGHTVVEAGRTTDIVAQNVGFGSGREYDRAKKVASKGSSKLQKAVDSKEVAVSTAAKLAELPKAQQDKALAGGKEAIKDAVMPDWAKGPTPQEQAKNDPGVRWSASLHKLYVFMTSTRDHGGIAKLARKWRDKTKAEYVVELRRIRGELQKWINALEGKS